MLAVSGAYLVSFCAQFDGYRTDGVRDPLSTSRSRVERTDIHDSQFTTWLPFGYSSPPGGGSQA